MISWFRNYKQKINIFFFKTNFLIFILYSKLFCRIDMLYARTYSWFKVLALWLQLVRITRQANDKFHMFRTDTFSLFLIHYSLMYSVINHPFEATSIMVQQRFLITYQPIVKLKFVNLSSDSSMRICSKEIGPLSLLFTVVWDNSLKSTDSIAIILCVNLFSLLKFTSFYVRSWSQRMNHRFTLFCLLFSLNWTR